MGIGRIPSEGPTTPHGFVWQDGVLSEVSFPGAFGTGLDGINEQGDVCGFIGPNGSGKTTTMRMLATLLNPDHGEAYASFVREPLLAAGGFDDDALDGLDAAAARLLLEGGFTTAAVPSILRRGQVGPSVAVNVGDGRI